MINIRDKKLNVLFQWVFGKSAYLVWNKTCIWRNGGIVCEGGHLLWKPENLLTKACPCKLSFHCFSKIPESNHFQRGSTYFVSWSWKSCSMIRRPLLLELWWGITAELMIKDGSCQLPAARKQRRYRKVQGSPISSKTQPSSLLMGLISYRCWYLQSSPQDGC